MERFDELVALLRSEGPRETWVTLGVEVDYEVLREAAVAAGDDVHVATFAGVGAVMVGRPMDGLPGSVRLVGDQYWQAAPAPLKRVSAEGRSTKYPHAEWAAEMRSREGEWVELTGVSLPYASTIPNGRPAAYAPSGTFEARSRAGRVWARFGSGEGEAGGPGRPSKYPHAEWVAEMRARPGEWVELEGVPYSYTTAVPSGQLAAYAPAGTFEARIRGGSVWARFGGGGDDDEGVRVYDHAAIRSAADAAAGSWVDAGEMPRSYTTQINGGRLGYKGYEAMYGMGRLWVRTKSSS